MPRRKPTKTLRQHYIDLFTKGELTLEDFESKPEVPFRTLAKLAREERVAKLIREHGGSLTAVGDVMGVSRQRVMQIAEGYEMRTGRDLPRKGY